MKKLIRAYTFNAAARTITFPDLNAIELGRVLLAVNVTDQEIIYNLADPARGGTVATNVLTLEHDTTAMDNTDKLAIFYEFPDVIDKFVSSEVTLVANTTSTITLDGGTVLEPVELSVVNVDGAALVRVTVDGSDPSTVTGADILPAAPGELTFPWDDQEATVKVRSPGTPLVKVTLRGRAV